MIDQNSFVETIRAVAEIVRTAEAPLSETEMLSYFSDMELSDEQRQQVLQYLKNMPDDEKADERVVDNPEFENRDDKPSVMQVYADELDVLPSYSDNEREQMYKELLSGDEKLITPIVEMWLPKVVDVAKKYAQEKIPVEDLIQEGNMALFLCLNELCGSDKEIDIEGHLKSAIEMGVMEYASMLAGELEHEKVMRGKVSLVYEAIRVLKEENGMEPTIEELLDYTKMQQEELKDIVDIIDKMTGE